MIADRLGVTKAAVYHQFPTKDEIVLAVIEPALARLAPLVQTAQRHRTPNARRQHLLGGIVDLVVEHRRLAAVLSYDPVVMRLVREHAVVPTLERILALLTGPQPDVATRVGVAMVAGGLISVGADPGMVPLPDDELRRQLLATACRTLGIRAPPADPAASPRPVPPARRSGSLSSAAGGRGAHLVAGPARGHRPETPRAHPVTPGQSTN